jgi:hypothetical protein
MADGVDKAATSRLAHALALLRLIDAVIGSGIPLYALLAVGHVPVANGRLDGDRHPGVPSADALSSFYLSQTEARNVRPQSISNKSSRPLRADGCNARRCCGGLSSAA